MRWGSTSNRADVDEFEFTGKLVIVCNSFPTTPDGAAVASRSYPLKIELTVDSAKVLLRDAARDKSFYPDRHRAKEVAEFLCERLSPGTLPRISYRTLDKGYDLATHSPSDWKRLFLKTLGPSAVDPKAFVADLAKQPLKVKEQVRRFEQATGLKRRTFFNYRTALQSNGQQRARKP